MEPASRLNVCVCVWEGKEKQSNTNLPEGSEAFRATLEGGDARPHTDWAHIPPKQNNYSHNGKV